MVQNMCFWEGKMKAWEVIGEGTGGKCGCLESWLFVCKGEEHSLVHNGLNEVDREGHGWKL